MNTAIAERLKLHNAQDVLRIKMGPDIRTVDKTVIPPREIQRVAVYVPDVAEAFAGLKIGMSLRSRRAQSGLDIPSISAQLLYAASEKGEHSSVVPVRNLTDRPHLIHQDTGFFAFNGRQGSRYFNNEELEHLIASKHIGVTGKEGIDWQFWSDPKRGIDGIQFRIDPASRTWIPPHPHDEVIDIPSDGTSRDFREYLAKHVLVPTDITPPPTDKPYLTVSETTSKAYLSHDMIGIIDRTIDNPGNNTHVNCELLYGGNTDNWPFRFENVVNPSQKPPEFVVVSFAVKE